jgi:hypothetical protein
MEILNSPIRVCVCPRKGPVPVPGEAQDALS